MAARQGTKDNGGVNQAAKSFVGFAERIARRDHIDAEEAESFLNEVAAYIQPGNTSAFAGAVALVIDLTTPVEQAPKIAAPLDVKPVKWATHKDKKTGKATHYTATWEGFRLRVDRTKPEGKIVFIGYVNDAEIFRGKSRVIVRAETESNARHQLSMKK